VSGQARPARTPPVAFDAAAWEEDMRRASTAGRAVADAARREFEEKGVAIEQLKPCDAEGSDGTRLPNCVKVYLPPPDGAHGMVFGIVRIDGRLQPLFAAFGLRHPGPRVRQPSVYQVAHRRLNPS
jgi:hypothetical protein